MQDFRKLDTWKKSHELVLSIYKVTQALPRDEVFGITMQLRRTAASIPTRVAAACGRDNQGDRASDLTKATAATSELEYALLLAGDLAYLNEEIVAKLSADVVEVRKMLFGLLRAL